jgi:hypothetical protein
MRKTDKNKNKEKATDEQKFPGYPKYPDREDITVQGSRLSINDEGLATTPENLSRTTGDLGTDDIIVPSSRKSESDLTKEDLQALGPADLSLDMGEDEDLLKHRSQPVDFAGDDLDVPGSELDDASESIGTEDEENNNYSLGSDKHEDLDERHSL